MKKILLMLFLSSISAVQAEKLYCVCNDRQAIMPDCGICGSRLGTMEKSKYGVACICENNLKASEISCAYVCKNNRGWSGEYQ